MKGTQLLFSLVASVLLTLTVDGVCAFSPTSVSRYGTLLDFSTKASVLSSLAIQAKHNDGEKEQFNRRRKLLQNAALIVLSTLVTTANSGPSWAEENMYAPKFVQEYEDFKRNPEGFSVRDVTVGKGESPQVGDRIVYEWSGYSKSRGLFDF